LGDALSNCQCLDGTDTDIPSGVISKVIRRCLDMDLLQSPPPSPDFLTHMD